MYTTYFGLREKPFNVTPDPRFFYSNPGYREAYANLLYGIRERKGFLVLTGEVGTGKTTILRRLMENLDSTIRFVFFYNTTLSFEELLSFICDELRLSPRGDGRLERIQALNEFLLEQLRNGSTGVLFIDEAQNLSEDVFENLRLLSNLETSTEKLLQIVLAGQPELERKLEQPQLRQLKQRIALQWRLDRLNEEEVGAFIDFRLRAVDCRKRHLFSREAIREIARYSKGIPRLVNIMCDNALLIAYGASQKRVSGSIVREVAGDLRLAREFQEPNYFKYRENQKQSVTILSRGPRRLLKVSEGAYVAKRLGNGSGSEPIPSPASVEEDFASSTFLDTLTNALTEAMGPMAPLVLRDQLAAFGSSPATFPRVRAEELVELVSSEILDDALKAGFRQRMSEAIRSLNGTVGRSTHSMTEAK